MVAYRKPFRQLRVDRIEDSVLDVAGATSDLDGRVVGDHRLGEQDVVEEDARIARLVDRVDESDRPAQVVVRVEQAVIEETTGEEYVAL